MRSIALAILFMLVPQLMLAGAGLREMCVGSGHVGFNCHEAEVRGEVRLTCDDEASHPDPCGADTTARAEEDCLDVSPVDSPIHVSAAWDLSWDWVILPLVYCGEVGPPSGLIRADDLESASLPRAFCARAHSCLIVIRC